jgi:hypothetical protein
MKPYAHSYTTTEEAAEATSTWKMQTIKTAASDLETQHHEQPASFMGDWAHDALDPKFDSQNRKLRAGQTLGLTGLWGPWKGLSEKDFLRVTL